MGVSTLLPINLLTEAAVGEGHADVFGLCAVLQMAELPAAVLALIVHARCRVSCTRTCWKAVEVLLTIFCKSCKWRNS